MLEAVARVPATARGPLRALTFRRVAGTHPQDPRACGQYDMTAHRIDLYDCAFVSTPTRVGPPGRAAGGAGLTTGAVRVVLHEIGHVIDRVPFNQAWQTFDRAQRAGTPGARRALEQARSQSGLRWQLGRSGDFEEATGGAGAAGNEFRQAALRDGQTRVTQYSEDAWEEYYAEAFSLYVTDPETLRRLRPNVYDYFARRLPDPARPANQPAGRSGRRP